MGLRKTLRLKAQVGLDSPDAPLLFRRVILLHAGTHAHTLAPYSNTHINYSLPFCLSLTLAHMHASRTDPVGASLVRWGGGGKPMTAPVCYWSVTNYFQQTSLTRLTLYPVLFPKKKKKRKEKQNSPQETGQQRLRMSLQWLWVSLSVWCLLKDPKNTSCPDALLPSYFLQLIRGGPKAFSRPVAIYSVPILGLPWGLLPVAWNPPTGRESGDTLTGTFLREEAAFLPWPPSLACP